MVAERLAKKVCSSPRSFDYWAERISSSLFRSIVLDMSSVEGLPARRGVRLGPAIIERTARTAAASLCNVLSRVRAPRRSTRAGSQEPLDVLCLATQGSGSADEQRLAYPLEPLRPRVLPVDRRHKSRVPASRLSARAPETRRIATRGRRGRWPAVMSADLLRCVPYILSSGDAVGPFLRAFHPATWPVAALYERALVRRCAGFIGWSPYWSAAR